MGTPIDSIMVAYQGFAKQNYTMLDNLKLGYGGTKSEMERLIKDANTLRVAQGKTGDLTIEKYSDVIEAIHLVQEEMGIAGTTEKEAAETIQGSLNATKSAWQNLLIAFGTGDTKRINNAFEGLVKYGKQFIKNVAPAAKNALKGMSMVIKELGPVIAQELPGLVSDIGPDFLSAIGTLAGAVITNLPAMLSALGGAIKEAITGNADASWPEVGQAILNGIYDTFTGGIDTIKGALGITSGLRWTEVGAAIKNGLDGVADAGLGLVKKFLGLDKEASLGEVAAAIKSGLDGAAEKGLDLIKGFLGLESGASLTEVGAAISNGLSGVVEGGIGLVASFLGLDEGATLGQVGQAILNGLKSAAEGGLDLVAGFLGLGEGATLGQVGHAILNGLATAAEGALGIVASFLGLSEDASIPEIGTALINGIEQAFHDLPKKGTAFIMDLLFGKSGSDAGETIAEAIVGDETETLANQVADYVGDPTVVSEKTGAITEAVGAVTSLISGSEEDGGILAHAEKTLAQKVADSIGDTSDVEERSTLIEASIEKIIKIFEYAVTAIGAVKLAGTVETVLKDVWSKVAKWGEKLTTLIGKHPILAMIVGGYFLSQEIDEYGTKLNYGDYHDQLEEREDISRAAAESSNARVNKLGETYDKLFEYNDEDSQQYETVAEQVGAFKDALPEMWATIAETLPDLEQVKAIQSVLDEGYSWDSILGDENAAAINDWEKFATDAFTGIGDAIKEALKGGSNLLDVDKAVSEIGLNTSDELKTDIESGMTEGATAGSTGMESTISEAGKTAADVIGAALDLAVSKPRELNISMGRSGGGEFYALRDLNANEQPWKKHATAMSHGEILRGLTPFGVGADGTMHFGGEAGAEAVVGVNSLDKMIQDSVNNAIGAVLGKMDTLINGQNRGDMQIVLDTGELVGGMKREIDKQLGSYGRWRGGGRA